MRESHVSLCTHFFIARTCNKGNGPLHGKTLNVVCNGMYPLTSLGPGGGDDSIGGISLVLLGIVADKMGFSFVPTADVSTYTYLNGTPGGAYGEVGGGLC